LCKNLGLSRPADKRVIKWSQPSCMQ